jgi:AAA ATPase domain
MRSRPTIAERVRAARQRGFVGRASEIELFRQAVEAPGEPPFTVLHLHGPGGIGKSALLRMFADIAAGLLVVRVDARDLAPGPDALRAALTPLDATDIRAVLLVDTYELLTPFDALLRDELLPGLPADVIVVLAGRRPPDPGWTADPGWRELVRLLPLAPLSRAEAAGYLEAVPMPDDERDRVLTFCAGYPLALVMAEELAGSGAGVPERLVEPGTVGVLVAQLVDAAPTAAHRAALRACALARSTDEALLRDVLGVDDATALLDWLRGQPYVEAGRRGVHPHDVVRDVLVADLRWRDPAAAAALHGLVRRGMIRRLRTGDEPRSEAVLDVLFDLRHGSATRGYFDWDAFGAVPPLPYRPADRAGLLELLAHRAGPAGAAPIIRWLDVQPEAFSVCREGAAIRGVVCWLALHDAPAAEVAADPLTAAAWRWAQERGQQPGQDVTMMRFFADRDADQRMSPTLDAGAVLHMRRVLTRPDIAFDFLVSTEPDYLVPLYGHILYDRVPELDAVLGDRRFGVFARDWRAAHDHERGVWSGVAPPRPAGDPRIAPAGTVPAEHAAAVRAALRDLSRPDLLARNPLAEPDGPEALRDRVLAAVEDLRGHPRDAKLYRALDRTYLRPATTQEGAAEVLGLPFSTYRRHLTQGVARVAARLQGGK